MKKILGISAFYHDSAATLIVDGEIIAAAQEERFTRIKHDSSYPFNAVKYCLSEANLKLRDIDAIIFFEKPFNSMLLSNPKVCLTEILISGLALNCDVLIFIFFLNSFLIDYKLK